ncbi:toprim domain-containing protein, partial [Flavonifractor plautii]
SAELPHAVPGQMAGAQLCSPVRHWRPGRVLDAGAAPQPPIRCALPVDHDEPGQTAARRLQEELQGAGYHSGILLPVHKDWNDDLVQGQTMAGLVMTMGQSM